MFYHHVVPVLLSLSLVSCGGGSSSTPKPDAKKAPAIDAMPMVPDAAPALTIAAYWTGYFNKVCMKSFVCKADFPPPAAGDPTFDDIFGTEMECKANGPAVGTSDTASVAAGRQSYDAAKAATCLVDLDVAVANQTCPAWWASNLSSACNEVFAPLVELGGTCTAGYECVGALICDTATKKCAAAPAFAPPKRNDIASRFRSTVLGVR